MNLTETEVKIQHGFKSIVIDLNYEKNKSVESLIKKYKDNLFISVPLTSLMITESKSNKVMELNDEANGGDFYIINLKHDGKGC